MAAPTLELKNVSKSFARKKVLEDVTFEASQGEIVGVSGPNGAGKSTLLRIISSQILPDTGTLRFHDRDINSKRKDFLSNLGYMPSMENSFFPRIRGEENLELFARLNGMKRTQFRNELQIWKRNLPSLRAALDTRYVFCSTGMKQILSLCRALIHSPELVLLDEPMKSVDEETCGYMMETIKDRTEKTGCTVIFVSHIRHVVDTLATKRHELREGRLALSSR